MDDANAKEPAENRLEVFGLKGKLGEICLEPGCTSAWDLARQVHSNFVLPNGAFWKLVIENALVMDKDMEVANIAAVTCVKHIPTDIEKANVVREVSKLLMRAGSMEDLPFEDHLICRVATMLLRSG